MPFQHPLQGTHVVYEGSIESMRGLVCVVVNYTHPTSPYHPPECGTFEFVVVDKRDALLGSHLYRVRSQSFRPATPDEIDAALGRTTEIAMSDWQDFLDAYGPELEDARNGHGEIPADTDADAANAAFVHLCSWVAALRTDALV